METEKLEGYWKSFAGEVKSRWGKLTDDDLTEAEGDHEKLIGKLQKLYGMTEQEARRQIIEIESRLRYAEKGAEKMYGGA